MKYHFLISAIALTASFATAQDSLATAPKTAAPVVADSATASAPAAMDSADASGATAAVSDSSVSNSPEAMATADSSQMLSAAADSIAAQKKAEPQKEVVSPEPVTQVTGTELQGNINGFLRVADSPYLVTKDLTVDKVSVLVIEPGVILQFKPGTGLHVQGQMIVAGSRENKVIFKSGSTKPKSGDWKGIVISGEGTSEIRNAVISNAASGIVAENSKLSLQFSTIEKTESRGLYVRNASVEVSDCEFNENAGAAIHVSSYSEANLERVKFNGNTVALYNDVLANAAVSASSFEKNTYAILDMGNNRLTLNSTAVQNNVVGASAADVLDQSVFESISKNNTDFTSDTKTVATALPSDPEPSGVERRHVNPNDKIGDLIENKAKEAAFADTTQKQWSIMGNLMLGGYYHHVKTNRGYDNTFQVPGFGAEASAYLLMQSPDGSTIEFNTNLTADSWNHFSPNPVTLSYTDQHNYLVLGDFQKNGGDIYMSGLPIFGAGYTLSLLKNNADQPLFEFSGFFGETHRPYALGSRHPYIYDNYIEDGEVQAQRIAYGGSFKWAPARRFDATFGVIYADDELKDPILRDGSGGNTSDPMQTSLTVYADGNWLFYPGDIELKGMVAVGRADTSDVIKERAINKVFSEAGLNATSYSTLRQLMKDETKINTLTSEELESIFGENTTLTRSAMRDSLRTLIRDAKLVKRDEDSDIEDSRVMGLNWGSQNFAIGASLFWNIYKTTISGHIKYVGEDYYSAGSEDQLADTREFGGYLEQIITGFWTLGFGYDLNIENAAIGGKTNLFGLNEGTRWGLFTSGTDDWFEKHELDNDRTKYIQNFNLKNDFKIGNNVSASVGYNLEYRTQYRPYQLHGDYILEDGIYRDAWFRVRKGKATYKLEDGENVTAIDSARWARYMSFIDEPYLASKFQERIFRNTWKADLSVKAFKSVFKVGGQWTLRSDNSKFFKDSLIDDMDLADSTWAKMGYYFGGADYFEQAYPISATTTLDRIQNHFAFVPRFKSYNRNNMSENEITVNDEFEISFLNRFLILGVNGEFRYMNTSWDEGESEAEETETDVLGGLSLRVNHTKHWSSEWYTGTAMYFRPDNKSDEYKDIYGGVRVNYVF